MRRKEAFSEYLTDANLDSRQIYFVNQIVEYIVHNGMMKDLFGTFRNHRSPTREVLLEYVHRYERHGQEMKRLSIQSYCQCSISGFI